jgi:hypothetical protein
MHIQHDDANARYNKTKYRAGNLTSFNIVKSLLLLLYSTVQYRTVQYSTVQHSVI